MTGFNFNSGGTLEVGGELTGHNGSVEGRRSIVLNGLNAEWNLHGDLGMGMTTSGNTLIVTNGAKVMVGDAMIGRNGDRNIISVGADSSLDVNGALDIGFYGSDNTINVTDGSQLNCYKATIGHHYKGGGNSVVISGVGAQWDYRSYLYVGYDGTGNSVVVSNGAHVRGDNSIIGYKGSSAVSNFVMVAGSGSIFENEDEVVVGENGRHNYLIVTRGGAVFAETIIVGYDGSDNQLVVDNGGYVQSDEAFIGVQDKADNNSVHISGMGSVWNNKGDMFIGYKGGECQLTISSGASVYNEGASIGYRSDDNRAVVSGDKSLWHNHETLYLGGYKSGSSWVDGGTGNSLMVENGGWVMVGDADTNNLPNIGTSGGLVVGDASGNAELVAANQSVIDTGYTYIGLALTSPAPFR